MAIKGIILLMVTISLSPSLARGLPQSAIASVLQDILSPDNTEKAMQLIKMASSRANMKMATPEMARAIPCGEFALPRRMVPSNDYAPARMIPSGYLPARAVVANEMPVRMLTNDGYARNVVGNPEISMQKMLRPIPVREMTPCQEIPPANPYLPMGYNPYLPVASPASAMAPPGLPPPTQSRGQFLRKIPIPPPTL